MRRRSASATRSPVRSPRPRSWSSPRPDPTVHSPQEGSSKMNFRRFLVLSSLALAGVVSAAAAVPALAAGAKQPLVLAGRTNLPGYDGDFDHLFADIGQNKLFVAAEDHGTVEVFNLKTGKHLRTLT